MDRCTPSAAEHDHEAKTHSGNDRAREEQPFDAVLDGVEDHEGEDDREQQQEQRAQQGVPQPRLD